MAVNVHQEGVSTPHQEGEDTTLDNYSSKSLPTSNHAGVGGLLSQPVLSVDSIVEAVRLQTGVQRIRDCRNTPLPLGNTVNLHADGTWRLFGMPRCTDRCCPHCAPLRAREDAIKLRLILEKIAAAAAAPDEARPFLALMMTYTFAHDEEMSEAEQHEVIKRALGGMSDFTRTKKLRAFNPFSRIAHFETTYRVDQERQRVRAHHHVHAIEIFETTADPEVVMAALRERWANRIDAAGHYAMRTITKGKDRPVTLHAEGSKVRLARYFAGDTAEKKGLDRPAPESIAGAALELTHSHTKTSARRERGGESFAAFGQRAAREQQGWLWEAYREAEQVGRGRNGARGSSFLRIGHALFELFATDDENGRDVLNRLVAEELEELAAKRDQEASPVIDTIHAPRDLLVAARARWSLTWLFSMLSGSDSMAAARWEQWCAVCEDVGELRGEQRREAIDTYLRLLSKWLAIIERKRRPDRPTDD